MKIIRLGALDESLYAKVGGKARGLDFLKKKGYKIADGFIVTDIDAVTDQNYLEIEKAFEGLSAQKVSVRSSASNEDGADFSNAGQYETCLDVDKAGLRAAIEKCISSLHGKRAEAYSEQFLNGDTSARMNIVVEEMVDAVYAGVVFSTNPVKKSDVLIEAVEGKGEDLVSGEKSAYRYSIPKTGYAVTGDGLLPEKILNEIYSDGLKITKDFGCEADLEWAADKAGNVFWLQIRPITTLDEADIDEFNTVNPLDNHLITTRNIGEMLPGSVTPLSISTSVYAIDYGIRNMIKKVGAIKRITDRPAFHTAFAYNYHLFFDMTSIYDISLGVSFADPKAMNVSIMGEYYENYPKPTGKKLNGFSRFINNFKLFKYTFSTKKARKNIKVISDNLLFTKNGDIKSVYVEIDKNLNAINDALCNHYVSSSFSGSMNSALFMTVADSFEEKSDYQAFVSTILSDIDGIESADILASLQKIAAAILSANANAKNFNEDELLAFVTDQNNGEVYKLYNEFIVKHGHRSIKEAEMRSKAWKNDPKSLMKNLRTVLVSDMKAEEKAPFNMDKLLVGFKGMKKSALKWIGNKARQAVRDREFTKSYIIKVIDKFKDRYAMLAKMLVDGGYLTDEDSIYFLSHKEIGELINGKKALKRRAVSRRAVFKESEELSFADVAVGIPEPLEVADVEGINEIKGIPVCKGKVYGRARVVKSFEDAGKIEKGEIMVAPFTDIGWSPYYSVVGALITEVGSALSHGAVVAREYCLPTVVNAKNATKIIKTGDYLMVDASKGVVTVISEEEYERKRSA